MFWRAIEGRPGERKGYFGTTQSHGVIEPEPYLALRPRLSDYSGKKIALVHNIKPGVPQLFDILEEMLKQKYPGVTIQRGFNPGIQAQAQEEHFQEIAKGCDAFVYAMEIEGLARGGVPPHNADGKVWSAWSTAGQLEFPEGRKISRC